MTPTPDQITQALKTAVDALNWYSIPTIYHEDCEGPYCTGCWKDLLRVRETKAAEALSQILPIYKELEK